MSFIDKFLDVTTPLPREIVRFLKLYKVVEERSKDLNSNLKKYRDIYLQKLKEKEMKSNDLISLKNIIDNQFKESLTLSDYKLEILKELNYILEFSFLKKIDPIIEEGRKECQEQILSSNLNITYGTTPYPNPLYNKGNNDDLISISDNNEKRKKTDFKVLGNKKNRQKNRTKIQGSEFSEEAIQSLQEGENKIYCKCKRPSYGQMIECESCGEWFHYKCVGIQEGSEPLEWHCENCDKKLKKTESKKKKKKSHN